MILITGGGGFLGRNAAFEFSSKGEEVLLLQRTQTEVPPFLRTSWGKQVKEASGDILKWNFICGLMKEYPIDSIVHAAAIWPGRGGIGSLYDVVSINVTATTNLLEIARVFGLRRVTFISSSSVYMGLDTEEDCHEDMPLPLTPSAAIPATKRAAEEICLLYANTYGLSVPIARVSRIYGPTARWRMNPMERMVVFAVEGKRADLSDTHEEMYTCPIHVKDCAKGIGLIHLKKELKHSIYNVSDGNFVNYREVANIIKELIPEAEIQFGNKKLPEIKHPRVSIERLKAEGWVPEYADLRKGLKEYIDYLKENKY